MSLSDPQQYFLQTMMNKGVINQIDFSKIFDNITQKFKLNYNGKTKKEFIPMFIKEINYLIKKFSMEIKSGVCEHTGLSFYCFIRQSDTSGIGKLSTLYSQVELKIFKKILVLIVNSEDGFIERNTLLNQIICEDDEIQTQVAKNVTSRDIRLAIEKFIHDFWLYEIPDKKERLALHGRAVLELNEYLNEIFDETTLNYCPLCKKLVLCGVSCDTCLKKVHFSCGKMYFAREKKCPNVIGKCTDTFSDDKINDFIEKLETAKNAYKQANVAHQNQE